MSSRKSILSGIKNYVKEWSLSSHEKELIRKNALLNAYAGGLPKDEGAAKGKATKFDFGEMGIIRDFDTEEIRELATSGPVRECINTIQSDVIQAEWDIVPIDPDNYNKEHLKHIKKWALRPNQNGESLSIIFGKATNDVLELDSGVIEKLWAAKMKSKHMVEIYARDGASFLKQQTVSGILGTIMPNVSYTYEVNGKQFNITEQNKKVAYWQSTGYNTGNSPIPFEKDEILWLCAHPRTNSPYGFSPVNTVQTQLRAIMSGIEEDMHYYEDGAIPQGVLSVSEVMNADEWKRFKEYVDETIEMKKRKFYTINAKDVKFITFPSTPKDRQFLETQKWYVNMVHAIFKVPNTELGYSDDAQSGSIDKSTNIYRDKALMPMLKLLSEQMNASIIPEFFRNEEGIHKGKFAGDDIDVMFTFKVTDLSLLKQRAEIAESYAKYSTRTINEIRALDHLKPVDWGNMAPAILLNPQQFFQSYYFGAPEGFLETFGVKMPKTRPAPQAVPQTVPNERTVKPPLKPGQQLGGQQENVSESPKKKLPSRTTKKNKR